MRKALVACLALATCAAGDTAGAVKSVTAVGGGSLAKYGTAVQVSCDAADYYVTFFSEKTARISLFTGTNTDPATALAAIDPTLVTATPPVLKPSDVTVAQVSGGWTITYKTLTVQVSTAAAFTIRDAHGNVIEETQALTYTPGASGSVKQTLSSTATQGYYGGGMQYGFNFKNAGPITIKKQEPSNAPFFMSGAVDRKNTFGVFANTWTTGSYDFASSVSLTHGVEAVTYKSLSYVDRFYMLGDFKTLLDEYTNIVGRPFMIPVYGLGMGDSNCYHNARHDQDSLTAVKIAQTYNKKNLPLGWQIFDDGYGCGIGKGPAKFPMNLTMVKEISDSLGDLGIVAGLWSSTGLHNFSTQVKDGIRVGKTDVGWVGNHGTQYAFDAVQEVATGIESNSNSRRFIYTCEGWAGTHKNAVMWTGDNSGSYKYEQMQMQYFVNAYMTGMAHVSGDVDGIFGGSPATYVRDIQMKSMQTAFMTMSGWATNPQRQPWADGLVTEGLARVYLDLKVQLTPYQYTMCREAHETGTPPARTLVMEFPDDATLYQNNTFTRSQFMSGPSLLVAPALTDAPTVQVYFPKSAKFYSFWDETSTYSNTPAGTAYPAPLHVLPLFVKEGSIIPMLPQGILHSKDVVKETTPITLNVWLSDAGTAEFTLYEDDGVTRDFEQGKYWKTLITASRDAKDKVTLTIGKAQGQTFTGAPATRQFNIVLHRFPNISGASKSYPNLAGRVTVNGKAISLFGCPDSLQSIAVDASGFAAQSRLLHVQTGPINPTGAATVVTMDASSV